MIVRLVICITLIAFFYRGVPRAMKATSGQVSHEWQAGAWTWGISCWLPVCCSRGINTLRLPWWWRPWAWTPCPSPSIIRCSLCTVSRWSQPSGSGCWKPIMRITLIEWRIMLLVSCNDIIIVDYFLAWYQCLLQYYDRTKIGCTVSLFICHLKRWLLLLIDQGICVVNTMYTEALPFWRSQVIARYLPSFVIPHILRLHLMPGCIVSFKRRCQYGQPWLLCHVCHTLMDYRGYEVHRQERIGLHLFNDDTRPSGHISRPRQERMWWEVSQYGTRSLS